MKKQNSSGEGQPSIELFVNRFLVFGKQTYTRETAAIVFEIFRSITLQTLTTEQGDDSACESDANQQVLKVAKSDSGITRHLKTSSKCRDVVCRSNFTSRFKVIARARNASHLGFLEALFIERYTPELCAQKEFVRTLGLF